MSPSGKIVPSLVVGLSFVVLSASLLAQARPNLHGPPEWIEARPPIHILPFVTSSPYGYSPTQMRHAYGFDQITGNGAGQTIGIVDAYGSSSIQNDLNHFCATYGLATTTVEVYYPQGVPRNNSGWALETSLDVEWAHAIAPGARIVLVVAKSAFLSDLLNAVDYAVAVGAKQVSMSWGGNEFSTEAQYDYHFNRSGVTFLASSGDSGAGVIWPASSPYVVGVGGTSLSLDAYGNVISETAWSGSGGGISAYEPRPAYQNAWQGASNRGVPDISYDADPNTGVPVYISNYNGSTGWVTVGGTSAGAPQWASLFALVNSARITSLSSADTALYSLGETNYSGDYRDITSGSNGSYVAGSGYDYVTGLGGPRANNLIPALWTNNTNNHTNNRSDFNGDGKADILWQNSSTGERVIWLMNGTTFQSQVNLPTVPTVWSIRNY